MCTGLLQLVMMNPSIRLARPEDRAALVNLLRQTDLLTDDLPDELAGFWLAEDETGLTGSAGLEVLGAVGLLRSVAVRPDCRGQYLASQLVDQARQHALATGLTDVYLITTTADGYFERLGFIPVLREAVPESISQTRQFSELCPDSAKVMHLAFTDR